MNYQTPEGKKEKENTNYKCIIKAEIVYYIIGLSDMLHVLFMVYPIYASLI